VGNLYEEVTDCIVAALEAGVPPWTKPWSLTPGLNIPCNAVTRCAYSGVNVLLLWLAHSNGWQTPRFLTFKQAIEAGGHVRKGEHGTRIYFVKDLKFKEVGANSDDDDERHVRMLKQYVVFNVAQCDDLPAGITNPPPPKPRHHDARDPVVEEFLTATGAQVRDGANKASYIVAADRIEMPLFTAFDSGATYYTALFHELGHWTGAKHRLDRDFSNRFQPKHQYAAEELVAEITSAFSCAEFSIDSGIEHASYIGGWIDLLRSDSRAIFTCASRAQAAVDYLRDLVLREPAQAAE
jgi:antirestriction protein ArdC